MKGKRARRVRSLVLGALFIASACQLIPPRDVLLIKGFTAHREQFETLANFMQEDDQVRVMTPAWLKTMAGEDERVDAVRATISKERWKEYRQLLEATGAKSITRSTDGPCRYHFRMYGFGNVTSESMKGLAYCPSPPEHLEESLDGAHATPREWAYRSVADNWYLYSYYD